MHVFKTFSAKLIAFTLIGFLGTFSVVSKDITAGNWSALAVCILGAVTTGLAYTMDPNHKDVTFEDVAVAGLGAITTKTTLTEGTALAPAKVETITTPVVSPVTIPIEVPSVTATPVAVGVPMPPSQTIN